MADDLGVPNGNDSPASDTDRGLPCIRARVDDRDIPDVRLFLALTFAAQFGRIFGACGRADRFTLDLETALHFADGYVGAERTTDPRSDKSV